MNLYVQMDRQMDGKGEGQVRRQDTLHYSATQCNIVQHTATHFKKHDERERERAREREKKRE